MLGVQPEATGADAKRAYFRLARQCHPDVRGSAAAPGAEGATDAGQHDSAATQRFTKVPTIECLHHTRPSSRTDMPLPGDHQLAEAYEVLRSNKPDARSGAADVAEAAPGNYSDLLFRASGRASPSAASQVWEYTYASRHSSFHAALPLACAALRSFLPLLTVCASASATKAYALRSFMFHTEPLWWTR